MDKKQALMMAAIALAGLKASAGEGATLRCFYGDCSIHNTDGSVTVRLDQGSENNIQSNLAKLNGLKIIGVTDLTSTTVPPNCGYHSVVCQSDIDSATNLRIENAAKLQKIVDLAESLK